MKKVIFACVHNAGRSQMASAFFNNFADPLKALAVSAGTAPAAQVNPEVVEVMREVSIDISRAHPQRLTAELAKDADLLVTLGCGDECPHVPGLRREDWPLEDPKGRRLEHVRAIRDQIRARVDALLARERWGPSRDEKSANRDAVLFLCTGNSARSQMAEALLRQQAGDRFDVHSAGLSPRPVHPLTREVLAELGIETGNLHSKDIKRFLGKIAVRFAIIVCEKAAAACPQLYPFAQQTLSWPFEDPASFEGTSEEKLEKFRQVRNQIDARIREWLGSSSERIR